MDLQTLLHNLHEEVSCSVCMSPFTDPKILPCFHTFCVHCLNELQRTSGKHGEITCPECRRKFQVPGSGYPKDLPANFRMNSLLDVMVIQKCNVAGVKCGNCDKTSAQSFYCFKCCAFWCDDCITAHNIIRANKDHKVLAIKDFQDQDIENVLRRPVFCQKEHHENKKLKFFCKDCEVAICNTCVVTLHEGHVKVPLQDAANERKLRLESVLESQKEKALRKRNMITRLQSECDEIKEQVACVKKGAQNLVDNLMRVIEAKKREIFKEVEVKAQQSIERLVEQQSEVENELQRIETSIEKTETFLKQSTNAEIVHFNTLFQVEVTSEAELVDCDRKDLRHFVFFPNKSLMAKANSEGVGSLKQIISQTKSCNSKAEGKGITEVTVGLKSQFTLTTRNAKNKQCYEQCDVVTVEIRNDNGRECATEAQVQDNKDGSYNISYFAKEAGTCQASVMVNGEHVSGSPFTVQVKPRQYKPLLSFGGEGSSAGMFDGPWGVAVNERNEIAVTDRYNKRVQIFSSDGTYLRSFGSMGDQEGEFNEPTGIAYLNNGNIVVADTFNNRLQIFTEQGEYLTQIGGEGNVDHQFNYPLGVSVDSDGNIIVADSNNKLIKIFTPSGQFLRKFGGEDLLVDPIHCIQKDQYFIVSDNGDHSIQVFNTEGDFLYKFENEGEGDGEFNKPKFLSVDKAGHLMVCDFENYRVQVLELNGKFITKFKLMRRGSPTSTTFSPSSEELLSSRGLEEDEDREDNSSVEY
ncbi:unnamed protein product [Porites lobata]|uniref:E3 ubiquitin-protein ligase TRIM71-like n=1 Tax=Porites lobata TaxID=104759 RepID=A0ABN8PGA3_9CNID|nr:unnamed protein product [Porites lobata]